MIAGAIGRRSGEIARETAPAGRYSVRVGEGLGELGERWRREAFRRAALPFGLACAGMPVLDLIERHSVVEQIAAGLQAGALPAVPAAGWLWIAYFSGLAIAAAVLLTRLESRGRRRLMLTCAALHAGYLLASGLRPASLAAIGLFAWSFVALQVAETLAGGAEPVSEGRSSETGR